jgi:hypothetical protein
MDKLNHFKMYCSSVTTRFLANGVKNGVSVVLVYTKRPVYVLVGKNLKMAQTPGRCKIWETWFLRTFGQGHTKSG